MPPTAGLSATASEQDRGADGSYCRSTPVTMAARSSMLDGEGDLSAGRSPRCFMHIPKSAGSSIHAALTAALPPGSMASCRCDTSVFCVFDDFELLRPEARALVATNRDEVQALSRFRAVSGHFTLPTLLQITSASSVATILREPRARLLSLYASWRTPSLTVFFAPYRAFDTAQCPLPEFLSKTQLALSIDNQLCRMLLDGDPRLPRTTFVAPGDVDAIAATAIEKLDELGCVGALELGQAAWQGVAQLFGVRLDPVRENVTGHGVELATVGSEACASSPEALSLLHQRVEADAIVYDYALARMGVEEAARRRLADDAFAQQQVRFDNLVGPSALRVARRRRRRLAISSKRALARLRRWLAARMPR